jgi:alanine racemase
MLPRSVASRPATAAKAFLARNEARRGRAAHAPQATIGGASVPLVGRVSMDQCCLDVTGLPEAQIGSEVRLPARRLAVSPLVPRVAVQDVADA